MTRKGHSADLAWKLLSKEEIRSRSSCSITGNVEGGTQDRDVTEGHFTAEEDSQRSDQANVWTSNGQISLHPVA